MNELLKLANEHFKLTDESGEVFIKSMELQMNSHSSTEVLSVAPVFLSKLLSELQKVTTVKYSDNGKLPSYKFSVNVSTSDMFASTESYNSLLIHNIVDDVVISNNKELLINSIHLEVDVDDRNICCYIRMSS